MEEAFGLGVSRVKSVSYSKSSTLEMTLVITLLRACVYIYGQELVSYLLSFFEGPVVAVEAGEFNGFGSVF
jgi:hypothetical protein